MATETTQTNETPKVKGLIQNINLKTKECAEAVYTAAGLQNKSRAGLFRSAVAAMARQVLEENDLLTDEYNKALDELENGSSDEE